MARKIVSLYIDDSEIRLLVMRAKEVLDWGELRLDPGLVKGSEIVQEAEVARKIKLIMKQFRIRGRRVTIGISGLFCITRPAILPQLPHALLAEAVKREARRLLPIPPEQCYLSWQTVPGPTDKTQVFMVAIPRRIADALFRTLRQAGLKPYHLDVKPLALARISTEDTAVILDLQPNELDIIVVSGGIPQPIRTVSLPESTLSDDEKAAHITSDVERTINFYNSNNPDKPIDAHVPLLVSGQLVGKPELYEPVTRAFGLSAATLQFPVRSPAGFKPSQYLVNIGLALHETAAAKSSGSAVAGLNCLPPDHIEKPLRFSRVMVVPVSVMLIAVLAMLIVLVQSATANITSLRNEISNTNKMVALKSSIIKGLTDNNTRLEQQANQVDASIKVFTAAGSLLIQERDDTNGDLESGTLAMPASVNMTSILYQADKMIVQGKSPDESGILEYARNLVASTRFSSVDISSIRSSDNITMDFMISLGLKGGR